MYYAFSPLTSHNGTLIICLLYQYIDLNKNDHTDGMIKRRWNVVVNITEIMVRTRLDFSAALYS